MPQPARGLILGSLTALIGLVLSVLPLGLDLEESLGLPLLFTLRGAQPPPADVVVVAIDRESAQALKLPGETPRWPRALHARLTDRLARAGASVIVFDLFFEDGSAGDDDRTFAGVMGRAGNVVLARYLTRQTVPVSAGSPSRPALAGVEQLRSPLPLLAASGVGSAPFPLPKVPVSVTQYWTFKPGAGGVPSLPVVAMQVDAADVYGDFIELVERAGYVLPAGLPRRGDSLLASRRLEEVMTTLHDVLESDARATDRLLGAVATLPAGQGRDRLRRLAAMYAGPSSRYLNFYGGPGTITTVSYHEVLDAPEMPAVRGKAVFIGVSEHLRPEQKDGFHTVFSSETGLDLSGVEIAATAYANLARDVHVRPLAPSTHGAAVVLAGLVLGAIGATLAPMLAGAAIVVGSVLYLATAHALFAAFALWPPLVVPLFVQAPLALFVGVVWRYTESNRERRRIRKLFSYYLPDHEISRLLNEVPGITSGSRLVYGICLSSDAERYTTLAESLDPGALAPFLNSYYASVFAPVKRYGGMVSDVIGDGALAIWAAPEPDRDLRERACLAACEIAKAVDRFNEQAPALPLPTRIGLHSGRMMLGNVGAIDHYEFRAVGDIVNTAARIQELNKHLGTRLLASEDVLEGLDAFLTRRLGTFLLAGKTRPLVVHEVLCRREDASAEQLCTVALFSEALAGWEEHDWRLAAETFTSLAEKEGDPPSRFYMKECDRYATDPALTFDAVIRMERK